MKLTALKNIIKEEIIKLQNENMHPSFPDDYSHPMDANLPTGQSMLGMNSWMMNWANTVENMPEANRCNFINGRIAGWQNKLNTAGPRYSNQLKMKLNIGVGVGIGRGCFPAGTHQTYNLSA